MRSPRRLPQIYDIDAVVFDLDGVLVDSEPVHFRAVNRALAPYGVTIDEAEYRSFIGMGAVATWDAWRASHGIAASTPELIAANTTARVEEITLGVPAIADAVALARELHRAAWPLAIASSSTRAVIDALLQALDLDAVFDVRVSGEDADVAHSKPAPDVYLAAAARLGIAPARCVAIEDSAPGVLSATRAGMLCVAVPNRWTAHQDFGDADVVLESLRYFPLLVL